MEASSVASSISGTNDDRDLLSRMLQKENSRLIDQCESLEQSLDVKTKELKDLQEKYETLVNAHDELQKESTEKVLRETQTVEALNTEIAELQSKYEEKILSLEQSNKELSQNFNESEKLNKNLFEQTKQLKSDLNDANTKYQILLKENSTGNSDLVLVKQNLKELQIETKTALLKQKQDSEKQIHELNGKVNQLFDLLEKQNEFMKTNLFSLANMKTNATKDSTLSASSSSIKDLQALSSSSQLKPKQFYVNFPNLSNDIKKLKCMDTIMKAHGTTRMNTCVNDLLVYKIGQHSMYMASAGDDNFIKIINLRTSEKNQVKKLFGHTHSVRAIKYFDLKNGGGKPGLISASTDKTIRIWDADDLTHIETISTQDGVRSLSTLKINNNDNNKSDSWIVAAGLLNGYVDIYDLSSSSSSSSYNNKIGSIQVHQSYIDSVQLCCMEKEEEKQKEVWLIAGTINGIVKIYNVNYNSTSTSEEDEQQPIAKLIRTLSGHKGSITSLLTFTTHNNNNNNKDLILATGGDNLDCQIKLWKLSDFSLITTLQGHTSMINHMRIITSNNNNNNNNTSYFLLSCSDDCTLKLWDLSSSSSSSYSLFHTIKSKTELLSLEVYSDESSSSNEGPTIVTGDYRGNLSFYWVNNNSFFTFSYK